LNEKEFPENSRFAITAAGAIPYYADYYFLDMLGINDKTISRQDVIDARPGHRKESSFEYLVQKEINFVIGHPHTMECASACDERGYPWSMPEEVLSQQRVYLMLNSSHCFRMFYLVKTPMINSLIERDDDLIVCE